MFGRLMLVLPLSRAGLCLIGDCLLVDAARRVIQLDVSERVGPGVGSLEGGEGYRSARGTTLGASCRRRDRREQSRRSCPKLKAGRYALIAVPPLANAEFSQFDGWMKFASYIDVRCSPVFPTYPICSVVLRATSCSRDTFHCQAFGIWPPVDLVALGETDALVKGVGASRDTVGVDADDEWRGAGQLLGDTHQFPLEELAGADSHRSSSIAEDIPGDAHARSDAVIVLLHKGRVRARSTVRKRQVHTNGRKELPLVGARSGPRYDQRAVAGIRWIRLGFAPRSRPPC